MARQRTVRILIVEHPSWRSLPKEDRDLLKAALAAARKAYAPYSRFRVGAALLLDERIVVTGSNQENASYPAGCCAERTALHAAMAQHPKAYVDAIAVVVPKVRRGEPVTPCGICRQALIEQEHRQGGHMRILLGMVNGAVHEIPSAESLLPLSFTPSMLKGGGRKRT
jgi:cytidine deaminase